MGREWKKVTHNNFPISSFWLFCYVQRIVRSPPQSHTHSRRLNLFSSPHNQIFVSSILFFSLLHMMKNVSGTWYRWWESMKTKKTHISALAAAFVRFGYSLPFQRIDFPWWFFSAVYSLWTLSYLSRMCWRLIYEYYELLTHEFWVNECEKIYMTEGWTAPKGAQKEQKKTRTCETEAGKT